MAAINFAGRAPTAMPYMPSQVPGAALRSRPWGKAAVHCLAPLDALDVCCCRFWWEGRMQSCLQGCQEGLWLVAAVRAAVSCWLLLWGWLWWWPLCRRGFWRWRSRRRSYHRCVSCTGCSGWRDNSWPERAGSAPAQMSRGTAGTRCAEVVRCTACQAPERQAQRRLRPQPEGQENAQPPPHQARG